MGAEVGSLLLLGGALSAVGGLGGAALSSSAASAVNEETMDFNAAEAEKARQFQKSMYQQQVADSTRMYKQFNSPQAIARQLKAIGVNPATIFSKGGSGMGGSAVVPSLGSSSQANVSGLLNPGAPYGSAFQNITSDAVNMLNNIADSELKKAETIHVLKQAYGQEFSNQILELQAVASKMLPQKMAAEVDDLIADAALKRANGKLSESQVSLNKILGLVYKQDIELKSQQYLEMVMRYSRLNEILDNEINLGKEQIKTERSKQSLNYSEVKLNDSNRNTVEQLRSWQVNYQKALSNIAETQDFVTSNTAWNEVQLSLYELEKAKMLPKQLQEAIKHAKKQNDWYEVNELLGIVDAGVKTTGAYYGAKTGKGFVDAQNVRNQIDKDYKDYLKNKPEKHKVYNVDTGDVYYK